MITNVTVTGVSDEGDTVVVWGRPHSAPADSEPDGYAFHTRSGRDAVALAEQASRLTPRVEAKIEYTAVVEGWHLAHGVTPLPSDR